MNFPLLLLAAGPSLFSPAVASHPQVAEAFRYLDSRAAASVDRWIRLIETPAPSGDEKDREAFLRRELATLGVTGLSTDAIGNLSALRKGSQPGPPIVFAAHMDTVFPRSVDVKVRRENGAIKAPGSGDDTAALAALLSLIEAMDHAGIRTRRDLLFLFTVQEETRLNGMREWMKNAQPKPSQVVAVDIGLGGVWYGAFRISRLKLVYTSAGAHTLQSRGAPNPAKAVAKAISDVYEIPLPKPAAGLGAMPLPVLNVGMIGGGTVINAIPLESWFTVDLRSLDSGTQDKLETQVVKTARAAAEAERVGFRVEKPNGEDLDYSRALPAAERAEHPLVRTAVDIQNHLKLGPGPVEPMDAGSTDANVGVAAGVPSIAVGVARSRGGHTLNEQSEEASLLLGTKMLVLLAASLAGLDR
jgi:acetylornithine deacetylase/succinyl-diaminopimelate desuccinylase-like protein